MNSSDTTDEPEQTRHLVRNCSDQKKANKYAKEKNRIAKKTLAQAKLNYEQAERHYLLEKSKLQPLFNLSVTEFLLTEPELMNDPEQASEALFLSEQNVVAEERVLRFQFTKISDGQFLLPQMIISRDGITKDDDFAHAKSDLLYFCPYRELSVHSELDTFFIYFIYRDQTTLPVLQKFKISKHHGSTLLRWDALHIDTAFAISRKVLPSLSSAARCEALF